MSGKTISKPRPQSASARKPRLLIDASTVTAIADGLSIYIINLLRYLPDHAFAAFDISILLNPGLERPEFFAALEGKPFRLVEAKVPPIGPKRDWALFRFFRRHGREFDLVHITSNNYPLVLRNGICTIHDVTFTRHFDSPGQWPGARRAAVAYMGMVIRNVLRRAGHIIADSEATRQDVKQEFAATPAQMAKMDVVHLGWEHLLDPIEDKGEPTPTQGFVYFLGSHRVHKNLEGLLQAWRLALKDIPDDKLLVVSGSSSKRLSPAAQEAMAAINADKERVVFTGYLSSGAVRRHYQDSDAFIFPSIAEGFGIPVLEAFHYEIPLLCSDRSSLAEVAGDAALFFDPTSVRSMADAIIRFCSEPDLGPSLVAAGRERLKAFSWRKTAEETVVVYRRHAGLPSLSPSPSSSDEPSERAPAHATP
jgi:glycosyltransferase involved in cell wall biosynthesis